MNMTLTEKESNCNFKCKNCSLKGINFNYFLSQEEDNNPKKENNGINNNDINKAKGPSIYDNSGINFPIPINSPQIYTNQPSDHYPYMIILLNVASSLIEMSHNLVIVHIKIILNLII
jgi:hypothetical protein